MGARYLCTHNISDDDCYRCAKHGLIFDSDCRGCPDFDDVRKHMTPELLKERERIMKQFGLKDKEVD